MNIHCLFILLCTIMSTVPVFADEKADSIATKELEEVIVIGDRAWIENGVINVVPSKQEKKLSNSPETLIESMHLPFVKVEDGNVTSLSGEKVAFYINGIEAGEIDIATFWPKEVTLLQYMENPDDPKYAGAKYVINFKMREYEAGGVTKLDGYQSFVNHGNYTAATKVSFKKWTYGFMFSSFYSRDHRDSMSGETKYKGIYYDNDFYDEITQTEERKLYERRDNIDLAVDARYVTDKLQMRHTLSFGWNRNPGSGSTSSNVWSDNLFDSEYSSAFSKYRSLSPQFKSIFFYPFSNKWSLQATAGYSYARNHSFTQTVFGESQPLDNSVVEDVNVLKFRVTPNFQLSEKWSFNFIAAATLNWFSSLYGGFVDTEQKQARQELSGTLRAWWHPLRSWYFVLEPGVIASLWKIGDINENNVSPKVDAQIFWNPTRKFTINGNFRFFFHPTSASESNPVLVRYSDLIWIKGNPYLKGNKEWNAYVSTSYIPLRELSFSLGVGYNKIYNYTYTRYTAAPAQYGGIIQETVNAKPVEDIRIGLTVSSYLFNRNLSISVRPAYSRHWAKEGGYKDMDDFTFRGRAEYTLGNCKFMIAYENVGSYYGFTGLDKTWRQDRWDAGFTYGTGDFYFDFTVANIFHNKAKEWKKFNTPNYSTYYNYLVNGRTFSFNLTYTFGYGKKVDKSIDISGPGEVSSSIRNADK